MSVYGFDIEIYKEISSGEDWRTISPLGITCAAIVGDDGNNFVFYPGCHYALDWRVTPPEPMGQKDLFALANRLDQLHRQGHTIVTWNGSFDFAVLYDELKVGDYWSDIVLNHVDPMFEVVCVRGHPVGLDKVAKAMGLPGKPEGMSGALAPAMWKESPEKRYEVIQYVIQDSITQRDVYLAIKNAGYLSWTARSGYKRSVAMKLRTVKECLALPVLSTPIVPRSNFYDLVLKEFTNG